MIYIDKLSENCSACFACAYVSDTCGVTSVHCTLGAFKYGWQDGCDEEDEILWDNVYSGKRHPNCPLILIDRWRLESCKTCGEDCCDAYQGGSHVMTCESWQPIDNESI
jgi:hypothetical protein